MKDAIAADASALLNSSGGGFWDLLPVAAIMALAFYYLYRRLWTKRGACSDCTSGGPSCSSCGPKAIEFDKTTPLKSGKGDKR